MTALSDFVKDFIGQLGWAETHRRASLISAIGVDGKFIDGIHKVNSTYGEEFKKVDDAFVPEFNVSGDLLIFVIALWQTSEMYAWSGGSFKVTGNEIKELLLKYIDDERTYIDRITKKSKTGKQLKEKINAVGYVENVNKLFADIFKSAIAANQTGGKRKSSKKGSKKSSKKHSKKGSKKQV